jgi:molecular chaperone DnaK
MFDIDANGIVKVTAKDKGTGREQRITIQPSTGLTKDEIDRMQREAELHADEDRRKRDSIELKNMADSSAYQAERTLRDNADKIPAELKEDAEAKIRDVRDAIAADDTDRIRTTFDALQASLSKIGEAVYGAMGQQPGPDGTGPDMGGAESTEGTVEGEFREV